MTRNLPLSILAFASFTGFTAWVVLREGLTGFIPLALEHGWGMQMLLDIAISLVVASFWIVSDAKKHGLSPWPFVIACIPLGSIGALAYLVYRALRLRGAPEARAIA